MKLFFQCSFIILYMIACLFFVSNAFAKTPVHSITDSILPSATSHFYFSPTYVNCTHPCSVKFENKTTAVLKIDSIPNASTSYWLGSIAPKHSFTYTWKSAKVTRLMVFDAKDQQWGNTLCYITIT